MKEELDNQLCEKYPYMFKERNMSAHQTCMCWGFAHGDGWFNILNTLCSNIESHINWTRQQRARALVFNRKLKRAIRANDPSMLHDPEWADKEWHINECNRQLANQEFREVSKYVHRVVAEQVKEKFGTLRFYYRGGDEVVYGMVRMAEAMSAVTCEQCGAPAKTGQHGGWVGTLCELHTREREVKRATGEW